MLTLEYFEQFDGKQSIYQTSLLRIQIASLKLDKVTS